MKSGAQFMLAIERAAKRKDKEIAQLVPIATELAKRARHHGVTISDVRLTAVQRGILTGAESGRELAYLGAVMKAAGLTATHETRRSTIEKSHGNRHTVWVDRAACAAPMDLFEAAS